MLHNANDQTTHQIDHQNHDAGHGIATHELGRTVHGTKEVCLLRDFSAALFGFSLLNQTCIQIRINGHLFAWHRIQSKASRYFSYAARALGNHHKVNNRNHQEDHDTHSKIVTNQKHAKSFDDLSGRICAFIAIHQHNTRRGYV